MPSILHLPVEILIQCFLFGAAGSPTFSFAVSHVCRMWRTAALSTPQLWAAIFASFPTEQILAYLERSERMALDLVFDTRAISNSQDELHFIKARTPLISQHLERCWRIACSTKSQAALADIAASFKRPSPLLEELELSVDTPVANYSALSIFWPSEYHATSIRSIRLQYSQLYLVNRRFPSLRRLELEWPDLPRPPSFESLVSHLKAAPNLETLVMSDTTPIIPIHHSLRALTSLPRLRRIEWWHPPASALYRLLSHLDTPALESISIDLAETTKRERNSTSADVEVRPVLCLPSLRTLNIQAVDADSLCAVVRRIIFPEIQYLNLYNTNGTTAMPFPLPRLESIFRDPRMPLIEQLCVVRFELHSGDGLNMLRHMTALQELVLDRCTGVDGVLQGLARAPMVCPKLTSLTLYAANVMDSTLLKLVEGRNRVGCLEDWWKGENKRVIKALKTSRRAVPPVVQSIDMTWSRVTFLKLVECAQLSKETLTRLGELVDEIQVREKES